MYIGCVYTSTYVFICICVYVMCTSQQVFDMFYSLWKLTIIFLPLCLYEPSIYNYIFIELSYLFSGLLISLAFIKGTQGERYEKRQ